MREISAQEITNTIRELCLKANFALRPDALEAVRKALEVEVSPTGRKILNQIIENSALAGTERLPICQDTGYVGVFLELGQDVRVAGDLTGAINEGVRIAYKEGYLRRSLVASPIFERVNTGDNTPAFIDVTIVPGDRLKITVMPKGGGTENASQLRMLRASAGVEAVKDFVLEAAEGAAKACPPVIVGVGIGGSFDKVGLLAKKALMRPLTDKHPDPRFAELEEELLVKINKLGIGPGGLGGKVTALGVKIETMATHIACLPCAVNFNCIAARQAATVL